MTENKTWLPASQTHQLHCTCSTVAGGWWPPYRTAQLETTPITKSYSPVLLEEHRLLWSGVLRGWTWRKGPGSVRPEKPLRETEALAYNIWRATDDFSQWFSTFFISWHINWILKFCGTPKICFFANLTKNRHNFDSFTPIAFVILAVVICFFL